MPRNKQECSEDCTDFHECSCGLCKCCSFCTETCSCVYAEKDPEKKIAKLMHLYSTICRITEAIIKSYSAMDDASDSECESSQEEEGGE